jgi:hypothetical protein
MLTSGPWLGVVVLVDYIAACATFAAAGGYLILKARNDQESALMRLVEEAARWFYSLGLHVMPGLPTDYVSLRNFADPTFADAYMIGMAALHLTAAAGFLALAVALGGFRPWARRFQLLLAMLALVVIAGYAVVSFRSPAASRPGFAAMAGAAVVPAGVVFILLSPGVSRQFGEGRTTTEADRRASVRLRILPVALLATYVTGILAVVLVASIPIALALRRALWPAP